MTPKSSPKKPPLTHFLCLPLITASSLPQLQPSLLKFKDLAGSQVPSAAAEPEEEGGDEDDQQDDEPTPSSAETRKAAPSTIIPERAFRPIGTLHLTLGVMSLDKESLEKAVKLLDEVDVEGMLRDAASDSQHKESVVLEPEPKEPSDETPLPLTISLSSLSTRPNESPSNCTVLYAAPIDSSNRLLPFCTFLLSKFIEAGFIEPLTRPLLLHATVVNTVYCGRGRRWRGKGGRGASGRDRGVGRVRLDVTGLAERMKEEVRGAEGDGGEEWTWAKDFRIEKAAICEMGAKKVEDEVLGEEYTMVGRKGLP
jgi:activating signal cointegrator complex subunit 1